MGAALKLLREFLEKIGIEVDRRTATSLLVLLVILILIPIGLLLVRQTQVFKPQAAGELIQLGDGGCIKVNKSKEKAVDCGLVPVKLTNPFFKATTGSSAPSSPVSSPSPAPSGSSPAPSASSNTTPQNVDVRNFNNDIQAALDSIKQSGGSVYLPQRTYQVSKKIRVFSNTTLFGDGIDKTIIEATGDLSATESVIGNDSNAGQTNVVLRDLTVVGNGNSDVIRFRNLNKGFIYKVKAGNAVTGILLGFQNDKGVNNVRISDCQVYGTLENGIFMTMGENNVIDNCSVDSQGSKSLGIGLEIVVDGKISGNRVVNNTVSNGNHSLTFTAGGSETGYESSWINSNNIICYNKAQNNDIQPIWDERGKDNLYVGNNVPVNNVNSFGFTEKSGTDSGCNIPASFNIPSQPAKPTAQNNSFFGSLVKNAHAQSAGQSSKLRYRLSESEAGLQQAQWREVAFVPGQTNLAALLGKMNSEVHAQDNDDQFLDAQDPNSDDDFLNNGTVNQSPGSSVPRSSSGPTPAIGPEFIETTFQLTNTTPGAKQIWVEFLHPNGASRKGNVNFTLIDKAPQILGLACNLDVSKQSLKITIDGAHFGNSVGTVESVAPAAKPEVLGWNDKEVIATFKKPNIPINEGQRFTIKLTRSDGFESGVAVCAVDKSLVSLGARIFCRAPGKFDANDVVVNLIYNPDPADPNKVSKIEEKVKISADGEIADLKTQLQVGKNYALAIKAPNSLRRATVFTAREGTTQITQPNGDPFILPIGDIAPTINPDGQINTLDRSELIRQWRVLGKATDTLSGDFNRDTKVNSIDWACMNYDFGDSDDPIPTFVPQSASDTLNIPGESGSGIGSITIPIRGQTVSTTPRASGTRAPSPSPSRSPSPSGAGSSIVNASDYDTLEQAVDALKNTGGVVKVGEGTWVQPAKTKIRSNVTIQGAGMGKTIIKLAPGIQDHILYTFSSGTPIQNVTIRDLTVEGHGGNEQSVGSDCSHGVKLENIEGGFIINVESKNNCLDGIYLGFSTPSGLTALDGKWGANNIRITGCKASGNGRVGIGIAQGKNNIIDNCESYNNGQSGLLLGFNRISFSGFVISGNKFINNNSHNNGDSGYGIGVDKSATNQQISGNSICGNRFSGNAKGNPMRDGENVGHDNFYAGNNPEVQNFQLGTGSQIGSPSDPKCAITLSAPPAV